MIARLLISPVLDARKNIIEEELKKNNFTRNHPDLLYFTQGEKLGIIEARKIKEHFSLKPYSAKGRMVVLENVSEMTTEAQNALLKTLEELPEESIFILGSVSDANLLPTVISRCQIIRLYSDTVDYKESQTNKYNEDIKKLLQSNIPERFQYIEKLKDKEEFLRFLVHTFRQILLNKQITIHSIIVERNVTQQDIKNFLRELLQGEKWARQNVNIRGILEYLMLVMPNKIC